MRLLTLWNLPQNIVLLMLLSISWQPFSQRWLRVPRTAARHCPGTMTGATGASFSMRFAIFGVCGSIPPLGQHNRSLTSNTQNQVRLPGEGLQRGEQDDTMFLHLRCLKSRLCFIPLYPCRGRKLANKHLWHETVCRVCRVSWVLVRGTGERTAMGGGCGGGLLQGKSVERVGVLKRPCREFLGLPGRGRGLSGRLWLDCVPAMNMRDGRHTVTLTC